MRHGRGVFTRRTIDTIRMLEIEFKNTTRHEKRALVG